MVFMGKDSKNTYGRLIGYVAVFVAIILLMFVPTDIGSASEIISLHAEETKKAGLNESKITLMVGETGNLYVDGLEAGDKVTYKSSKKKVASVGATGIVTAKKKGSANITATVKHLDGTSDKYKCKVKVIKAKAENVPEYTVVNGKGELENALASGEDGAYRLKAGMSGIKDPFHITGNITIDLNGNLVRGSSEYALFQVSDGGSLTLVDSSSKKDSTILNTGSGCVVTCFDGTLILDAGYLMSQGESVVYSEGNLTVKDVKFSGGSISNLYVKKGTALINGGDFFGSHRGISLAEGEVVINDAVIESEVSALQLNGGTMVVYGGTYKTTDDKGYIAALKNGTFISNGGNSTIGAIGIIAEKGRVIVNGGSFTAGKNPESYGIHAVNTSGETQITVNGGTVTAGYAGMLLENVSEGSAVINGGTIESTGPVAVSVKDSEITVTGGKISCENTALYVNNESENTALITGGTFTAETCVSVMGKTDMSITGGKFKAENNALIINSNVSGKIEYDKSLLKKILDQRGDGEEKTDNASSNAYKRFDVKYKKGMYVEDFDTLYSLVCVAFEQLTDEIDIYTSPEVFNALYRNFGDLYRKYSGTAETTRINANQISYSDGRTEYVIKLTFGMESQINSISLNKSVYKKADKTVRKYSDEIDEILDSIIGEDMTDEEKITAVHDYMCENYEYADPIVETGLKSDHSFHAMLDDGTGVCQAYATLFHVMMLKLGIEDTLVVGKGASNEQATKWEDHMWNCVVLDGNEYFIDITWDDSLGNTDYLLKSAKDFYANGQHLQEDFWK